MQVLDQYLSAINRGDIKQHLSSYHFPHFRYASGTLHQWQTLAEATRFFGSRSSPGTGKSVKALTTALGTEWHLSRWLRRDIIQARPQQVHVAATFGRYRNDNSLIATYQAVYIMTKENDRWGIKGRSTFAP